MEPADVTRMAELGPGDHLCCIYQTDDEHRAVVTPYMKNGLVSGDKVVYIVDDRTADVVFDYLRDDGIDVAASTSEGRLVVLTSDESYTRNGMFDPDGMIEYLARETRRAVDQGYRALRVTGEMSWALKGLPGSERLMEYEAKLNQFFPDHQCMAICQYDRRRFSADVLLDVLHTHPLAVIGREIYDNFYYVPPADFLGRDPHRAMFDQWIENLADRRRTLEALRRENDLVNRLVETSPVGIILESRGGELLRANARAERLLGLIKTETGYRRPDWPVTDFDGRPLPRGQRPSQRAAVKGEAIYGGKLILHRPDGAKVYLSVNSGPLYDRNGEFLAVVSAVQDVTQDIETRRSLERHASQLARSNQELDQFVHVASHDLREPLDTVHSFLALFERRYRDRLDDNGLDLVHRASEAADRMRGLIEDLRAFGRLESGAADFAPVDLGQAAAEARRNLAAAVAKTGAWIDLDDSLPVVMGRHGQLVRLFQNLFHNAIKFRSDRPPEIHVHGQPVDGGWEIVVRDNGIGFDPDRAGEIFALFRRLHTREEYEGTGLGLALCQKIAQIHGGSIRAESRPGRGADFIVFLPQAGRPHQ